MKNISFLIAASAIIITIIFLCERNAQATSTATKPATENGGCDKKVATDHAKKNYILRRFIS